MVHDHEISPPGGIVGIAHHALEHGAHLRAGICVDLDPIRAQTAGNGGPIIHGDAPGHRPGKLALGLPEWALGIVGNRFGSPAQLFYQLLDLLTICPQPLQRRFAAAGLLVEARDCTLLLPLGGFQITDPLFLFQLQIGKRGVFFVNFCGKYVDSGDIFGDHVDLAGAQPPQISVISQISAKFGRIALIEQQLEGFTAPHEICGAQLSGKVSFSLLLGSLPLGPFCRQLLARAGALGTF